MSYHPQSGEGGISTSSVVDATAGGAVSMGVIGGTGTDFLPASAQVELDTILNVTVFPTLSVGTNAPSYNNVVAATAVTLNTAGGVARLPITLTPASAVTPGQTLFANVTSAAAPAAPVQTDIAPSISNLIYGAPAFQNFNDFGAASIQVGISNPSVGATRSLVKFSGIAIPMGHTLVSASLNLYLIGHTDITAPATVAINRLLQNWDPAFATWNDYASATPWQTPGATGATDINTTASATFAIPATPAAGYYESTSLTSDVQNILTGGNNYGWLLSSTAIETGTKLLDFGSESYSNPTLRPYLKLLSQPSGGYDYDLTVTIIGLNS